MSQGKGWGLELMDRVQNEGVVHHEVVDRLEQLTKRCTVAYFTFFGHPAGLITDDDAALLETVLRSVDLDQHEGKLDLVLHSPGGSPTAAEKVILTCRSFAKDFRVVVPRSAMSAATLVCMGADALLMAETSEIGPIDPQMVIKLPGQDGVEMRPAAAFVAAYLDLIKRAQEAIKAGEPPHPFIELLRRQDPVFVQMCLKARDLARTIAVEYLGRYQLQGKPPDEIQRIADTFLEEGEKGSHGRVIRGKKAQDYGLNVELADKNGEQWRTVWELYMRCEHYVQTRRLAKYIVTSHGGLNVQVQAIRL